VLWQHVGCVLSNVQRATQSATEPGFSQAQCKLPEDGPSGPKHIGANRRYFIVNFNILYD
jgi:hypothetical protein